MFPHLLFSLLLVLATCRGQLDWYPVEGDYAEHREDNPCDHMFCVAPCPGAAPPPYCPVNVTTCRSGCACMRLCKAPTEVCFMSKYCVSRRRYLKRTNTPLRLKAVHKN